MDDDLFFTIIYLVPVALVIFFRVLGGGKKAQASKDRQAREQAARRELARRLQADLEASGRAVPLSRISGREPESQEWEPHWVSESDSDLAEAAAGRPVAEIPDEEGPEAGQRLAFLETETGLRAPMPDARDFADFAPSLAARPAQAPGTAGVGRFDDYPITGAGPSLPSPADLSITEAEVSRPAPRAAAGPLPGAVERLPPLKRAVILSEILGPPKGA